MRSHLQLLVVTVLAVAVASPAWAVPAKFNQQGRLLDVSGQPLTGTHALVFALYDASTGGVQQWSEYHSTDFDSGYYTVTLGDVTPLDDALFSGAPLWLEIAVDGVTLEPRQEVAAVPWALRAISAERVDGGVVDAASISIGGTEVINNSGAWVGPTPSVDWTELSGVPSDIADGDQNTDSLASLLCAEGQVAKWTAGAWACADDVDTVTTSLAWGFLTSIPPDIADGDQDTDTLGDLSSLCLDGDRAAWDATLSQWICAPSQVSLTQLDTTGAAAGQVLTFDGFNVGWDGAGSTTGAPCTLASLDAAAGAALLNCGSDSFPVKVPITYSEIHTGQDFGCGILQNGELKCWGSDVAGQTDSPAGAFIDVSTANNSACALTTEGNILCWGSGGSSYMPPSGSGYSQIDGGRDFHCVLHPNGATQCFGGFTGYPSVDLVEITAGGYHACGLDAAGLATCWGDNSRGQSSPPPGTFSQLSAGGQHTCGIDNAGNLVCWGAGTTDTGIAPDYGQAIPPSGSFVSISAGMYYSCGVRDTGAVVCWGLNNYGEASPPAGNFANVSASMQHFYARTCGVLQQSGTVACWGNNRGGAASPP